MAKLEDKAAKELTQAQQELRDITNEQTTAQRKLNKSLDKTSDKFQTMVKSVAKSNQGMAENLVNIKKFTDNTFAGALQGRKANELQETITQIGLRGVDEQMKLSDEYQRLNDAFAGEDIDWEGYQKINDKIATHKADWESGLAAQGELEDERRKLVTAQTQEASDHLAGNAQYARRVKELQDAREVAMAISEAHNKSGSSASYTALKNQQAAITDLELRRDAIKLNTMSAIEKNHAIELDLLDAKLDAEKDSNTEHLRLLSEQQGLQENINDKTYDILDKITSNEGRFGKFSDGIKELTGIDLGGMADSMITSINAVGDVFGKDDLAGAMFEGIQGALKSVGPMMSKAGAALKTASLGFLKGMWGIIKQMFAQAKKLILMIPAFIASAVLFVISMWTSISAMAAAAMAIIAPVLPFILIGLAIVALAALLIWGGMWLYENSEVFRNAIDAVVGYFMDIVSIIGDIFGGFYDFFAGLFSGDFDRMFSGLEDIFGGLWDLFLAPFRAIGDFIKETFGIDIGGWLTDKLREWLPGWALNLLGMGGDEGTDALQAGLVDETDKATQKEDLASAKESGLYEESWMGDSSIDKSKMGEATDAQLQAIMRDNDISEEDRSMVLDTLNQRQVDAGGQDVAAQIGDAREEGLSGAALAERTEGLKTAGEGAGDASVTANTVVTTNSPTNNNLTVAKNARETDSTLGRVSSSGYAFGPFGPEPA